jgi:hypothetical protein
MSEVLAYLTANTKVFPLKQVLFATAPALHTQIQGHIVKEVKVVKSPGKNLPIPIKVLMKKSPDLGRTCKRFSSPVVSPVHSPKTLSTWKIAQMKNGLVTQQDSPRKIEKINSPRKDIKNILKLAIKQEKKKKKAEKNKFLEEHKLKLQKRIKLKVFDEFIRRENLQKFKQRLPLTRPKWGDKKNDRAKEKPPKPRRDSISILLKSKKPFKKLEKNSAPEENNFFKSQKPKFPKNLKILKIFTKILENHLKKKSFFVLKHFAPSDSVSFGSEDIEVQKIMHKPKSSTQNEEKKCEINKSYEKILENQVKMKFLQKKQLVGLKSKDLQEMNKLAEVLGNNPNIKEKFQEMIDRRYSKLENLFEENLENIKQVLGLENYSIEVSLEEMIEKPRNSELSSSFLVQIQEVPLNEQVFRSLDEKSESQENSLRISFKEEKSFGSSRKFSEEFQPELPVFFKKNLPVELKTEEEEPGWPLISESLITEAKINENSEELALNIMVKDIKSQNISEGVLEGTLELKAEKPQKSNPMLILEDSFSSSISDRDPTFSTICKIQPPDLEFPTFEESKEEKSQTKGTLKPKTSLRPFIENFPGFQSFSANIDPSTETEGLGLLIQRVFLMLELDIFAQIIENLVIDDEFFLKILQKSSSKVRSLGLVFGIQVETDEKAVISLVNKLKTTKSSEKIISSLLHLYNPLQMLADIQENTENIEEIVIFDYCDLDQIEFSLDSSREQSSEQVNPFLETHSKAVVDALNEALVRTSKNFIEVPWKIAGHAAALNFDKIFSVSVKKIKTWFNVQAGTIPSFDMINSLGVIDDDRLQAKRQDNLALLLTVDNREEDHDWIECAFEESQTAIDVTEWIFNWVVIETAQVLMK